MAVVEQNISGVKLEKMRKRVCRLTFLAIKGAKAVFAVGVVVTLFRQRHFIRYIAEGHWQAAIGAGAMAAGGLMMSFCVAAAFYAVCSMLFWSRSYNLFNQNYKNKYVLTKMRETPGFSALKYTAGRGLPFGGLAKAKLLPVSSETYFKSKDYFEGVYDRIRFCSGSVETFDTASAATLFEGQVIIFSAFHEFKISETPVQIFSSKENGKMKGRTLPHKIETENAAFNRKFSVFAEDGHTAFYILTPQVLEDITEFAGLFPGATYMAFAGESMYVGCAQLHNPFDAFVDVPVEEQSANIKKAAEVIRKARDIMIDIGRREGENAQDGRNEL